MTIFDTLIIVPLKEITAKLTGYLPAVLDAVHLIVGVFLILIVGLLLAKFLHDILQRILKDIHIDKMSDHIGLSGLLHKGGVKSHLSGLISSFVYLVMVFMFVIMALEMIGLTSASTLLATIVGYTPQVIAAVFVLAVGMILAKMVGHMVYGVAANLTLPNPKLHQKISTYAILIYAVKVSLEELGFGFLFVGTVFHIWFAGVVLALALAYGLGHDTVITSLGKKKRH